MVLPMYRSRPEDQLEEGGVVDLLDFCLLPVMTHRCSQRLWLGRVRSQCPCMPASQTERSLDAKHGAERGGTQRDEKVE